MSGWIFWSAARDVTLFALAIWGAALSTFNWRQAARKDRRILRVTASSAIPAYGDELGNTYAVITATNIGYRTVTVNNLYFALPGGASLFATRDDKFARQLSTPLPSTISDGQSAKLAIAYADIGQALITRGGEGEVAIVPACEDSTGERHVGTAWKINPREARNM